MKLRFLLLSSLFVIIFIASFNFISFRSQSFVISDINNDVTSLDYEEIDNLFILFPNLSATTIPLNIFKAIYYLKYNDTDSALSILDEPLSQINPYIHYNDFVKAKIYYHLEIFDSAFYYSKKAFYGWPKNLEHYSLYNEVLVKNKDTLEILKAYDYINEVFYDRSEYAKTFIQSMAKAKLSSLVTYTNLSSINLYEYHGSWIKVVEFENQKPIVYENTILQIQDERNLTSNGIKYLYEQKGDTVYLKHFNNPDNIISFFLVKFSKKENTLILRPSSENGFKRDLYFKNEVLLETNK